MNHALPMLRFCALALMVAILDPVARVLAQTPPLSPPPTEGSPATAGKAAGGADAAERGASVAALLARGRAQFLAGEASAACETLRQALALEPENREARAYLQRATERLRRDGDRDRATTRDVMMHDVEQSWRREESAGDRGPAPGSAGAESPLARKLRTIVVPSVNFAGVELGRVVATLSAVAEECDATALPPRGVNLVLLDPSAAKPAVTIALRDLSLQRVLDFVTESVGYQYEIRGDVVVIRPGGERPALETAVFSVSRATVLRLSGAGRTAPAEKAGERASPATGDESAAIRAFLQQAGVKFEGVEGGSLVYDGSALLVTQSARNLERIRAILRRYADVRQVEIEAKFMEVQEGVLDELGINWTVGRSNDRSSQEFATVNRSVAAAFANSQTGGSIIVDGQSVASVGPPPLPGVVPLGAGMAALAQVSGFIGEFDVSAVIRALSQKQGSDLLSAPKVTVLSGSAATITIAQQLRYPRQFGQIQSQVGQTTSSGQSTGSAGVTITAGTPQDFTTENVGVDLRVTPTVEDDDCSITLDLHPVVTEFEGFVEYGGPSLAISGGRTVTIPSGFYQPIFSRREVNTRVTIWDGATLVMGGLTREEGRKVKDKVPLLGDLPAVGRLFRTQGEGAAKRSLLIFVTARLVNPGGAPKRNGRAITAETK